MFPSCKHDESSCKIFKADPTYERGSRFRTRWLAQLQKHLPQFKFDQKVIVMCQCHFKNEQILPSTSGTIKLTDDAELVVGEVKTHVEDQSKIRGLESELKFYKIRYEAMMEESRMIRSKLTPNQYRAFSGVKVVQYDSEDIVLGILMRSRMSRLAYDQLRDYFPLPSLSTLDEKCRRITMTSGLLDPVIDALIESGKNESPEGLHCGLLHDEMAIKSVEEYDPVTNCLVGTVSNEFKADGNDYHLATKVLVIMLKGLFIS